LWLPGKKNWEWLLDFPEVRDWRENGLQPTSTRVSYVKGLSRICLALKTKPPDLLQLDEKELGKLVESALSKWTGAKKNATAKQTWLGVKSFLKWHDKHISLRRPIKVVRRKVAYEKIPRKSEVFEMANHCGSVRNRAIILCLFQSGVRVNCISKWKVALVREQLSAPEMKLPIILKITPELDTKIESYGLAYYPAFLQSDGAVALKKYLEERTVREGPLDDKDFIFKPEAAQHSNPYLAPLQILLAVKTAARRVGIDPKTIWTHCLRKAYRKVLNNAELDEDTREALMGHLPPGARASYFDLHDEAEIGEKYLRARFDSEGVAEARLEEQATKITDLRTEVETIRKELAERTTMLFTIRLSQVENTYDQFRLDLKRMQGAGLKIGSLNTLMKELKREIEQRKQHWDEAQTLQEERAAYAHLDLNAGGLIDEIDMKAKSKFGVSLLARDEEKWRKLLAKKKRFR